MPSSRLRSAKAPFWPIRPFLAEKGLIYPRRSLHRLILLSLPNLNGFSQRFVLFNEKDGVPLWVLARDILLSPTGSLQTYTSDSDWNNATNKIEVVAGGGAGAIGASTTTGGGGGAGGGYNSISNFVFSPLGTTAQYQIGAAGLHGGTRPGGDTWFNAAAFPAAGTAVGAKGGPAPTTTTTATGGAAPATTTFFPITTPPARAGGSGGNGASATAGGGGGGGGGPNGAGGSGSGTAGGTGDGATVSAGAAGSPGTSFVGTEWITGGTGAGVGGGAGGSNASAGTGGTALALGGGAGGGSRNNGVAGDGGAGGIILSWQPGFLIPSQLDCNALIRLGYIMLPY